MHRFFVPPEWIGEHEARFEGDTARQISQVLRLKTGATVAALDNQGREALVELTAVDARSCSGRVLECRATPGEPSARLTLYLGLTQREKFEWMLQKCTELGAAAFVPVITSRALVQDGREVANKLERWQRITQEAAEQSGRGRIPPVSAPLRLEQALKAAPAPAFILWEGERALSLAAAIAAAGRPGALALFVGPEGGYAETEIQQARAAGIQAVTLGRRILRMETAAMAATALAMAALGEMG